MSLETDLPLLSSPSSREDMWIDLIKEAGWATVVEVGVWKGDFSAAILGSCPSVRTYYMADPWKHMSSWNKPANVSQSEFERIYEEAKTKTSFAAERRRILRASSVEAAKLVPDGTVDLVYIDGDHTLRGIAIDLVAWWPKLTPTGVIGGDDFSPNIWHHDSSFEPTLVFPFAVYFAEAVGAEITALPFDQFVVRRTPNGFRFNDPASAYPSPILLPQVKPPRVGLRDDVARLVRGALRR